MKTNIIIYISSIVILIVAVILVLGNPDSGRINLIAGGMTGVGFLLNILSFATKKSRSTN